MQDTLVIIPTYNEKENVEKAIRKVFIQEHLFDVLIIDDHSTDGTSEIVKRLMDTFPDRLHLHERPGKLGLGTAYICGFEWALKRSYKFICEMDADLSHNPDDLVRLYRKCADEGFDVSVGSRYIKGVTVVNWPMSRVILSYFASAYVRFITGMEIRDTTAGFKCYRREVLELIDLSMIKFQGYAFQIEMKFAAWKLGFKIAEIPIIFTDRNEGHSKMSKGIIREAIWGVIKMKFLSFFRSYRKK